MSGTRWLFAADMHGNKEQYDRIFAHAATHCSCVLLGGDLTPKDPSHRTIEAQRSFLLDYLVPQLRSFKKQTNGNCPVLLMFGNDDFRVNEDVLYAAQKELLCVVLHGDSVVVDGVSIVGYPFVPFTPFQFKDWERPDLTDLAEDSYGRVFVSDGVCSTSSGLKPVSLATLDRSLSIERCVCDLLRKNPGAVLMSHAPPADTKLDLNREDLHVGSKGIRVAIEKYAPRLSLHGHVHETVDLTGTFKECIGTTISASVGNFHTTEHVWVLLCDPQAVASIERVKL